MAKKSRGYVAVSFEQAIELVGEERLKLGQEDTTVANWRAGRPVPWDVLGPILARAFSTHPTAHRQLLVENAEGDLRALRGFPAVRDLLEALQPDAPLDELAQLPPGYMQRYRERSKDVGERLNQHGRQLQRELQEFRQALLNEYRARQRKS